jgi:hypothetical protein
MKNASLPVTACIFIFVLAAVVFAGTTQTGRPFPDAKRFIGTVVVADTTTNTLVVRSWRGEMVFDATSARFAGQSSLKSLEPGERVFIRYIEKGELKVATSIIKAPVKQAAEKKAGADVQIQKPADAPESQ